MMIANDCFEGLKMIGSMIDGRPDDALILIAGPSCSGKSFLLSKLGDIFPEMSSVGGDAYFKDADDQSLPRDDRGRCDFDRPSSYRGKVLLTDVLMLLSGRDIFLPKYDIKNNRLLDGRGPLVKAGNPVAVDFLCAIEMLSDIHRNIIRVYVDANRDTCLRRRIERDVKAYGVSEDQVRKIFFGRIWPNFAPYARRQRNNADIVIFNNE